jgi:hypothetical protein
MEGHPPHPPRFQTTKLSICLPTMSFPLGAAHLLHAQQVVLSGGWRNRFAPYLHDSMCCDEEWQFRLQQGLEGVSLRSPSAEIERARANAYSDSEKRREVQALTPFTRSITGLRDTLNHILRRFVDVTCDDKMLRAFSSVIYPTLRQAVVDLHKPANLVATPLLCETLQRAIRFLLQMFCIASAAASAGEFLGDKCIGIAKQLLECACLAHIRRELQLLSLSIAHSPLAGTCLPLTGSYGATKLTPPIAANFALL